MTDSVPSGAPGIKNFQLTTKGLIQTKAPFKKRDKA